MGRAAADGGKATPGRGRERERVTALPTDKRILARFPEDTPTTTCASLCAGGLRWVPLRGRERSSSHEEQSPQERLVRQ